MANNSRRVSSSDASTSQPEVFLFGGRLLHETALLCYSSGTSGGGEGVQVKLSLHPPTPAVIVASVDPSSRHSPINNLLVLVTSDHAQEYGAVNCLMSPIHRGMESVPMSKFGLSGFLRCIDGYKATHAWVVPPICLGLLGHPRECIYTFA